MLFMHVFKWFLAGRNAAKCEATTTTKGNRVRRFAPTEFGLYLIINKAVFIIIHCSLRTQNTVKKMVNATQVVPPLFRGMCISGISIRINIYANSKTYQKTETNSFSPINGQADESAVFHYRVCKKNGKIINISFISRFLCAVARSS